MKRFFQRVISVFIVLLILIGIIPANVLTVSAESNVNSNNETTEVDLSESNNVTSDNTDFEYEITENGVRITAYWGKDTYLKIPSVIQNKPVIEIGRNAFDGCTSITSITIPDTDIKICEDAFLHTGYYDDAANWENGVLYIGEYLIKAKLDITGSLTIKNGTKYIADYAFEYCRLSCVDIPNSVISIGDCAFYECRSLSSINVPDSVTSIGDLAFSGCASLSSINIPDSVTSIGDRVFTSTEYYNNSSNWYNKVLYINNHLIKAKTDITGTYEIKEGTKSIAYGAFRECKKLTGILFNDGLIHIGAFAFCWCIELADIKLPDSVTSIGESAFVHCDKFTNVMIPGSVTKIGDYAFGLCSKLTRIVVDPSNAFYSSDENDVLYNIDKTELILYPQGNTRSNYTLSSSVLRIADEAFSGCTSLSSINIPDSVTSIGDFAFYDCTSLSSINIPDSVTSIGDHAFFDCTSLSSINIPDSATSIGDYAFYECTSLSSINIPDSVTSIGDLAFARCTSLSDIIISSNVTRIGKSAFYGTGYYNDSTNWSNNVLYINNYLISTNTDFTGFCEVKEGTKLISDNAFEFCRSLSSISIPDSVIGIGDYAFSDCTSLSSINIPDSVTRIGKRTFSDCSKLSSINIPDSVISIGDYAFCYCTSLSSINIPESVSSIGIWAFYSCSNLSSINIPDKVTSIGLETFSYCDRLLSVNIGNGVVSIGEGAFENCSNISDLTIGKNVNVVREDAFRYCGDIESINYLGDLSDWCSIVWYNSYSQPVSYSSTLYFNGDLLEGNLILPDGLRNVSNYAFYGCTSLSSINIPDSVTSVGENAFSGCTSLSSINIPDSVTSIGGGAFARCTSLSGIIIPDSVISIGEDAFYGCTSLSSINIPDSVTSIGLGTFTFCSGLKNVSIGRGITVISNYLFMECSSLRSISIPDTVTNIEDGAFLNCNSLYTVYFQGSDLQWNEISIGDSNEYLESIEILYNCDSLDVPVYSPFLKANDNGEISLFWMKHFNKEIVKYEVIANSNVIATTGNLYYIDNNTSGENITYIIRGVTSDGRKTPDAVIECFYPEKILNVIAVGDYEDIKLSWSKSSEVDSDTYNIYRSVGSANNFELYKSISDRNSLTYTDIDVIEGEKYYYYVVTKNSLGLSGKPSDIAVAMRATDTEAPLVTKFTPSSNTYITDNAIITVAAVDNLMVTSIKLYYSFDDGETWTFIGEDTSYPYNFVFNTTDFEDGIVKMKAVACDAQGNESEPMTCLYSIDNSGPEKVTGLSAKEVHTSQLTLKWNDVSSNDAACFVLQRKNGNSYETIARSITTLGYNISNLRADTEYTYRVAAIDVHGNIGEYSDDFTVRTLEDTTPPVVTSLSPSPSRYNNNISFRASAGDDCAIKSISIQVSSDKVKWETINTAEFSSYNKTATYAYNISLDKYSEGSIFVRAVATDYSGNVSDTSENAGFVEYYVDKSAPNKPRDLVASGGDGWIYISWLQGDEEDLNTYYLYRSTEEDSNYQLIASNLKTISYYDSNAQRDVVYYYKLRVIDTTGNISEFSEAVSAKVADDVAAPEVVNINPVNGSYVGPAYSTVEALVKDNNCLESIVIEYRINDSAEFETLKEFKNIGKYYTTVRTQLPITELDDGDKIFIRVYATDICGLTSEYSAEYIYTVDKVAPTLTNLSVNVDDDNAVLSWKNDSDSDVSGYKIYRMNEDGSFIYIGSRSKSNRDSYVFYDYLLNLGDGDYVYKIEAYDRVGNFNSFLTNPIHYEHVRENKAPIANINGFAIMELGVEEYFDAGYSTDDTGIVSYTWDFGDGTTSNEVKVIKKYENIGTYTVTLTVIDDDGVSVTETMEVTVNERIAVGTVKVTVVDENGDPVASAPVYFNLGTDEQKVVYSDSNGVASMLLEKGDRDIGVYKPGYLPAQKNVTVLPNATRTVTMTIIEQYIVSGEFEVTRMTFSEIEDAGIDVYSPANQNVYKVHAVVKYAGSAVPITYIRNDSEIISYTVSDTGGDKVDDNVESESDNICSDRQIASVSFIPNEANEEVIAVLDIPAEASYSKEFFDTKLHIINNATSDFVLVDNNVHLNVPEGMSLMTDLKGDYSEQADVSFESLRGQETKTINWILRGDTEGDYHLSADYSAVLDRFNANVTATFKTEEPIKVYGLSAMKFVVEVNDEIKYNALYFNFILENISSIDIYNPMLDFDGLVSNITASTKQKAEGIENSAEADFDSVSSLLNVRVEYNDGTSQYVPFNWNENGTVKIDVDTLSPGDSICYEYVAYNVVNYDDIMYFKDATAEVLSGYSENVEIKSVPMNMFSMLNFEEKLSNSAIQFENAGFSEDANNSSEFANNHTYYARFRSGFCDNEYLEYQYPFLYDDSFFYSSASNGIIPGLAVASLGVASTAYLSEKGIHSLLGNDGLGFDSLYSKNYDIKATENYNDYVAFTFGHKEMQIDEDTYNLIVVAVRGTPGSLEWLSNFNIGVGGDVHDGFNKAATELLLELENYLDALNLQKDNTKIWIAGHSRGAAVSNIVAEKLTDTQKYADADNIYAYTFATPSTSIYANESYKNIINFCNSSDLICQVPLDKWGFKKAGTTVYFEENNDHKTAFRIYTDITYAASSEDTSDLVKVLERIAPTVKDLYNNGNDEILKVIAYILAGKFGDIADIEPALLSLSNTLISNPKASKDFVELVKSLIVKYRGASFIKHPHSQESYFAFLNSVYSYQSILNSILKAKGNVIEPIDINRNSALKYILDDSNYLYMTNSTIFDRLDIAEYYLSKFIFELDFSAITKEDQIDVAKEMLLEIITDKLVYDNIDEAIDDQYISAVKNVLGVLSDNTSYQLNDGDRDSLVTISKSILSNKNKIGKLATSLKLEGSSGLKHELLLEFKNQAISAIALEAIHQMIQKTCDLSDFSSDLFKGLSGAGKYGGMVIDFFIENPIDAANSTEYDEYIHTMINIHSCRNEAELILKSIINLYSEDFITKQAAISGVSLLSNLLGPQQLIVLPALLLSKTDMDPKEIVYLAAVQMLEDMNKDFNYNMEYIYNLLKSNAEDVAKLGFKKTLKSISSKFGSKINVYYAILSTAFSILDKGLGLDEEYSNRVRFNIASFISLTMRLGFESRYSAYLDCDKIDILNSTYGCTYSTDNLDKIACDGIIFLKSLIKMRLTGERALYSDISKNNADWMEDDAEYDAKAVEKGNLKFGTSFVTSEDLFDYIYGNILKARDVIFNIEYTSDVIKPLAPTVTFNYDTNSTFEVFDSSYEYCLSDGEWKSCDGRIISVTPTTHAITLRVRKASGAGSVAGEITTVTVKAQRELSKTITAKYDNNAYFIDNTLSIYDYEICLVDNEFSIPDWSKSKSFKGSPQVIVDAEFSPYIAIRTCGNDELRETVSQYRIIKVQTAQKLNIDVWGNGKVEQSDSSGTYFIGADVALTAIPEDGAVFVGWFIDGEKVSSDLEYLLEMYPDAEITAKFEGGTVIEATKLDISISTQNKELYTQSDEPVFNTNSLSPDATVYSGTTAKLNAGVYPENSQNKAVVWSSSDENVATVADNGEITFVSNGDVVITATLENGVSNTFTVRVLENKVVNIYIAKPANKTLYTDNENIDLAGMVVVAVYSDGSRNQITDYVVGGYSNEVGTHTITLSYEGCETSFNVEVIHNCEWILAKESTCSQEGLYEFACKNCHEVISTQAIETVPHKFDWKITTQATHTENGIKSYICSVCSYVSDTKEYEWCDHTFDIHVVNPTCESKGYTVSVCTKCDESIISDETSELGHKYSDKVIAPSCGTIGYTVHSCDVCGYKYVSDKVVALEHNYSVSKVEATCSSEGGIKHHCSVCGDEYFTDSIGKKPHSYYTEIIDPTCETSGYTKYICSVCGDSYIADEQEMLGHDLTVEKVSGDCTEGSYVLNSCTRCDDSFKTEEVLPREHEFGDWLVRTPADEGHAGIMYRVCVLCGKEETKDIPVTDHEHVPGEWIVEKDASCIEYGIKAQKCTSCGEVIRTEQIESLGHSITEEKVEVTCDTDGYTLRSCSKCDFEEKTDIVESSGHSESPWISTVEPTCTSDGERKKICVVCEETVKVEVVQATGHTSDTWVITKDATCDEPGERVKVCLTCNETFENEVIKPTGHKYVSLITDPTCTQGGNTTYLCSICNSSYISDHTDALGHSYGEWYISEPATCQHSGLEVRGCINCDSTETREIPQLAHNYVLTVTEATCTERGYTTYTCSECDESYIDNYVDATGHSFGEWQVTANATCTIKGEETSYCSRCDETQTREIDALGHTYEKKVTEATCTEQGYTTYTCSCGDSYVANYIHALGHKPGEWIVTKQPTEKVEGVETLKCSVCQAVIDTRVIPVIKPQGKVIAVDVYNMSINYKAETTVATDVITEGSVGYTVTYSSSNTSVARVDNNGKVIGVGKGNATITCTVTDEFGNSVSDTCNIEVKYTWWQWIIKIVLFGWIWY